MQYPSYRHPICPQCDFCRLTPLAIDKIMPNLWLNDNEAGGKNRHEEDFLKRQMQSQGRSGKLYFDKIVRSDAGKRAVGQH